MCFYLLKLDIKATPNCTQKYAIYLILKIIDLNQGFEKINGSESGLSKKWWIQIRVVKKAMDKNQG